MIHTDPSERGALLFMRYPGAVCEILRVRSDSMRAGVVVRVLPPILSDLGSGGVRRFLCKERPPQELLH